MKHGKNRMEPARVRNGPGRPRNEDRRPILEVVKVGDLAICPHCKGRELRVLRKNEFHRDIECAKCGARLRETMD